MLENFYIKRIRMHNAKTVIKLLLLSLVLLSFQACSIKIPVDTPKASQESYTAGDNTNELNVKFESTLSQEHSVAVGKRTGVFKLKHQGDDINANAFIKAALEKELAARKIPMQFVTGTDNSLSLDHFEILTHRVSGFSPLVTLTTLQVKIDKDGQANTFVSMVKKAKTPVWSMVEVNEPCYNEPTTLIVKEIVAKINKHYFDYKLSDAQVQTLKEKITANEQPKLTYLDIYELGFSNNKSALEFLKTLTTSSDEYTRLAAISSIGTLGGADDLDFLVALNKNSAVWQDRVMVLKSIGDLNTQESMMYLKERKEVLQGADSMESEWSLKIIGLYL